MSEPLEFHLPYAATKDAEAGRVSQFGATDKLLDVIKHQLAGVLPAKDLVLKAAGDAYDKYVAPIDIPFVPNLIEPMVDAQLRSLFLGAVGRMYDALASKAAAASA